MKVKKPKYEFIDYLFWFLFILFTNPGGIFKAFGEDTSSKGTIDSFDFIFVLLLGCFLIASQRGKINNTNYKKIVKYLIIFGLYYLVVFGFFIPIFKETLDYTPFSFLKKSRKTIYSLFMFVMVYRFYLRSHIIFFKTLVISSIIVLVLFIITAVTGFEILPVSKINRRFVNVDRIFIANEGLMGLLIPMGAVLLVFKSKLKWKKLILIAYILMFLNYILSITRRDIIGTFVYLFLAMILYNYFQNKALIPIKKMVTVSFYVVIIGFFISFTFPKYLDAGTAGLQEAANVIQYGQTSSGKKDVRLGFGKEFMQDLIKKNYVFGTGFDNRWRGTGDKAGYETSDYPLLSAIAMYGIIGLLIFLPIYITLVRAVIFDIKFLKKHKMNYNSFDFYIITLFVLYFIYDLLQYMNWFLPVSLSRNFKWYTILSMYFASRHIFYAKFNSNIKRNRNLKPVTW